jgi:hypothetical protein
MRMLEFISNQVPMEELREISAKGMARQAS